MPFRTLGFVSFDFDLTLTKQHTWKTLGLKKDTPQNAVLASTQIELINPLITESLIRFVCERKMAFVITTLQYRSIVLAGLNRHPNIRALIQQYGGKYFFIFDRNDVNGRGRGSKAILLQEAFMRKKTTDMSTVSGIHFDDDAREKEAFKRAGAVGICFAHMSEGTGVSSTLDSSLMKGITAVSSLERVAHISKTPQSDYSNAGMEPVWDYSFDYDFKVRRSANYTIARFITDFILAAQNQQTNFQDSDTPH